MTTRRQFIRSTLIAAAGSACVSETIQAGETAALSPIIDCQSHLYVPEMVALMKKRTTDPLVYEKEGAQWIKMGDWHRKILPKHMDVPAKIADMDANNIKVTALSINDPGPEWFENDGPAVAAVMNDFIAQIAREHPGRFVGLCVLPLQDRPAAEKELQRCIDVLDMRGILLYTNLVGAWPDEPQFRWLFQTAVNLDVPILLHPAKPATTEQVKGYDLTSTMGNMFEDTIALARLIASGLLDEFPKLKLVCPHLGGALPYMAGRFDHQVTVLKRSNQNLQRKPSQYMREQVYFDIVSPQPLAMKFAVEFSGPDRLLFGSDHPWVDPKLILDSLRSLHLPPEHEAAILYNNASKIFKL